MENPEEKSVELMKRTICLINNWNYEWAADKSIEEIKKNRDIRMSWWRAKETTQFYVQEILSNTPMYNGNLNPTWEFWYEVKIIIENI